MITEPGVTRRKTYDKMKKKKNLSWAALSDIFSRLHAAVIVYFGAPARADTVSDRDWCKINTSQECDVLINSLCCSDREARHVRGGLQRRPLCSCQVWPSKADEAVRLLIYLYWQAPSPPLKPSSLSASLKKICSASKTQATGLDARSKAKYILKANSLPFATCFYCRRSSSLGRAFSWNLGWIGSSFQSAWQPGEPQELSADISLGLVYAQGSAWALTPRTHSLRRYHESVPQTEIKMWKAARPKAFLTPRGIFLSLWQLLWDRFFFHVSFLPLDYLTTCGPSCQRETCLIDRARECFSQHGVKFDFLHVQYASLKLVIASAWCFLMDQLSIITCCDAKHNGNYDTCHNLLLGQGNWNNLMTANLVFVLNLIMAAVIVLDKKNWGWNITAYLK